ncbi:MAG: hypothetical protein V1899_10315, partial [Planctomycetota bacterium]
YSLRSAEPEEPHIPMPELLNAETLLLHARNRNSLGCDTEEDKWALLLRLEDLFMSVGFTMNIPFTAPGQLTFREDWGPYWHEVGNPSGGGWLGKYRTFLLETADGSQFMFGVALLGMMKAVEHPSYGNRKSTSVLIGALSFDANYHPGIQFAICQSMTKAGGVWRFHHDGRITIGKGAGSRAALIDHVRSLAPELVVDGQIYLGSLPDSILQWSHVKDFLARFASYTWLRHQFKEQVRSKRSENAT